MRGGGDEAVPRPSLRAEGSGSLPEFSGTQQCLPERLLETPLRYGLYGPSEPVTSRITIMGAASVDQIPTKKSSQNLSVFQLFQTNQKLIAMTVKI